jgi:hypothetical protein
MKNSSWLFVCCACLLVAEQGSAQFTQMGGFVEPPPVVNVLERGIEVHGGREKLARSAGAYVSRGKGTMYPSVGELRLFTFEYWHQDASHTRLELHIAFKDGYVPSIRAVNGVSGWEQQGTRARDLTDAEMKQARQGAYETKVRLFYPLLDEPGFALTALGESTLGSRYTAVGVRVGSPGQPEVRLYFDKESGLLLKSEARESLQGRTVLREEFYSNYHDGPDGKYPGEVLFQLDGKKYLEIETTEMQLLGRIDPAKFSKP